MSEIRQKKFQYFFWSYLNPIQTQKWNTSSESTGIQLLLYCHIVREPSKKLVPIEGTKQNLFYVVNTPQGITKMHDRLFRRVAQVFYQTFENLMFMHQNGPIGDFLKKHLQQIKLLQNVFYGVCVLVCDYVITYKQLEIKKTHKYNMIFVYFLKKNVCKIPSI